MSLGEFDFIRRYLVHQPNRPDVVLGIGDDAAIVRAQAGQDWCISADMLLAGRHFFGDERPEDIAHKIVAVNLSDMAAMGAVPSWILLSAALPELDEAWLTPFCQGLFAIAAEYGVALIGGDTTRGDYVFNLTIAGQVPTGTALRRSGAHVGDDVWVSGQVGLAAAALQHRLGELSLPPALLQRCNRSLQRPTPRISTAVGLRSLAHAALDVSDGLAQDLSHVLRASGVGARILAHHIPGDADLQRLLPPAQYRQLVLAGGDDYELLFTAAPAERAAIEALALSTGVPLSIIGTITAQSGVLNIIDEKGEPIVLCKQGFDHFGKT